MSQVECPDCDGVGRTTLPADCQCMDNYRRGCPVCHGAGVVPMLTDCLRCEGEGRVTACEADDCGSAAEPSERFCGYCLDAAAAEQARDHLIGQEGYDPVERR